MTTEATPIKPWHVVRRSKLHGNGVFAARKIPAGTRIIEYGGERISAKEADRRHPTNPDDPFHTFFFALSSGRVIDGGDQGNDARWINHSCQPNCEAQEGKHGKRVYIVALDDIPRGTELFYDYGLVLDGRITKSLKEGYRCLCGTPPCRGTMLALKAKKAKKTKADKPQAEVPAEPVKTIEATKAIKAVKAVEAVEAVEAPAVKQATKTPRARKSTKVTKATEAVQPEAVQSEASPTSTTAPTSTTPRAKRRAPARSVTPPTPDAA